MHAEGPPELLVGSCDPFHRARRYSFDRGSLPAPAQEAEGTTARAAPRPIDTGCTGTHIGPAPVSPDSSGGGRGGIGPLHLQRSDLLAIDAPKGKRDAVAVQEDDAARALLVVLQPGEELGEHQVHENVSITVVSGEVSVRADEEQIGAGQRTLLRLEPAERQSLSTTAGTRLLIVLGPGAGHNPLSERRPEPSLGAAFGAEWVELGR